MTESEWLTSKHWFLLVLHLQRTCRVVQRKAGRRKLRLLACGCCRQVWNLLVQAQSREALEVVERFADGLASDEQRREAERSAGLVAMQFWQTSEELEGYECREARRHYSATAGVQRSAATEDLFKAVGDAVARVADIIGKYGEDTSGAEKWLDDMVTLVRDIFGNPFRPVTLKPPWKTPTILALATAAYENRILPAGTLEPARLAILADALEDAGCDNEDILNHLRQPGVHVRGCWVVDLILGKE